MILTLNAEFENKDDIPLDLQYVSDSAVLYIARTEVDLTKKRYELSVFPPTRYAGENQVVSRGKKQILVPGKTRELFLLKSNIPLSTKTGSNLTPGPHYLLVTSIVQAADSRKEDDLEVVSKVKKFSSPAPSGYGACK
jgi:hypothetical protein